MKKEYRQLKTRAMSMEGNTDDTYPNTMAALTRLTDEGWFIYATHATAGNIIYLMSREILGDE